MSFDYLFKFIVIGDARVGKTSYCLRLTHDQFVHEECNTIGVEFSTSVFNIGGNIIKCQFWDTAGCERFRAITRSYYRGVTAAIMVFDLSNTESFKSLEKWKKELLNNAEDDLHVLVVGTKTDKKPKVKMEDILKLIGEVGLPIAGSLAMGYFIFLTIKQMMAGVVGQVKTLTSFCEALTTRARVMSNEMIKIDLLVSSALELRPDIDRIARAENFVEDGKVDSRRD